MAFRVLPRFPPSVRLMLMRSHRPHGLERQQVVGPCQIAVPVLTLEPQVHELALPPGDVGNDPPFRVGQPARRLDIVVPGAEYPALAGSGLEIEKRAVAVGRRTELGCVKAIALCPEGDVAPSAGLGWPI